MGVSYEIGVVDFGAGSGKVFTLGFDGERIYTEEQHRFPNHPILIRGGLYNDVAYLYDQAKAGILRAVSKKGELASIGFDAWGNDYGMLNQKGELISLPHNYRDSRTFEFEKLRTIDERVHYSITGIPSVRTNAYNQLLCETNGMSEKNMDQIKAVLMMPDLLAYFLTGDISSEYTEISTSSLVEAATRDWSDEVLSSLPLKRSVFSQIVPPGTIIGRLNDKDLDVGGLRKTQFIKTVSHDTGAAVISAPLEDDNDIYLSCGSISLIGIEVKGYLINENTFLGQYHNQGLPEGKMRIQKSIMGLWILQQCMAEWKLKNPRLTFGQIEEMARREKPFQSYIDVTASRFSLPGNMTLKIQEYCMETGQKIPHTEGELARCVYESLVLKYRAAVQELDQIAGRTHRCVCILNGGTQDKLLTAMLADATGKEVKIGLQNASAAGNALMQLIALGKIENVAEARKIVDKSIAVSRIEPSENKIWENMLQNAREIEKIYANRRDQCGEHNGKSNGFGASGVW